MKSVFSELQCPCKARADESIEGNLKKTIFCSPPDWVRKEGLLSEFATCI